MRVSNLYLEKNPNELTADSYSKTGMIQHVSTFSQITGEKMQTGLYKMF